MATTLGTYVTAQQRQDWDRDGWLVLKDLLRGKARRTLDAWVTAVAQPGGLRERRLHYYEQTSEGRVLCRTERFLEDHLQLARLIATGVLPSIAGELIGEPVLIYKEKINYKQPGGAGYRAHQDATAYAFIRRHVTCLVAVDAMTSENGCLEFAPHGMPTLLAEDGDGCIAAEVAARLDWRPVAVSVGDVVFFGSHVPHRSGPNRAATPRRALYLTYNAASEGARRSDYYDQRDHLLTQRARRGDTAARISTIGHFEGRPADEGSG
jgi:ectoine hydroxylase-related dioxygenase (phytanoyl-CoA dioxygenase family)